MEVQYNRAHETRQMVDRENDAERHERRSLDLFSASLAYGVGSAALQLGIARGILDDLTTLAMTKTPRPATPSLRVRPVFQIELARLEARYRAARVYSHSTADDVFRRVAEADHIALEDRTTLKLATAHTIHEGVDIVAGAYRNAGSDALFPTIPFEQSLRDAYTASQQTQARVQNFLTIDRCLLGLEPDTMTFLRPLCRQTGKFKQAEDDCIIPTLVVVDDRSGSMSIILPVLCSLEMRRPFNWTRLRQRLQKHARTRLRGVL